MLFFVKSPACTAALICLPLTAWPTAGDAATFPARTVVDPPVRSQVTDIERGQAGYLWLATARGLHGYDGNEFDPGKTAGDLLHSSTTALCVSARPAHTLSLASTTNFVEKEAILETLTKPGVDRVQGSTIGEPRALVPRLFESPDSGDGNSNVHLQNG